MVYNFFMMYICCCCCWFLKLTSTQRDFVCYLISIVQSTVKVISGSVNREAKHNSSYHKLKSDSLSWCVGSGLSLSEWTRVAEIRNEAIMGAGEARNAIFSGLSWEDTFDSLGFSADGIFIPTSTIPHHGHAKWKSFSKVQRQRGAKLIVICVIM